MRKRKERKNSARKERRWKTVQEKEGEDKNRKISTEIHRKGKRQIPGVSP